jgi:hypothetical protein
MEKIQENGFFLTPKKYIKKTNKKKKWKETR